MRPPKRLCNPWGQQAWLDINYNSLQRTRRSRVPAISLGDSGKPHEASSSTPGPSRRCRCRSRYPPPVPCLLPARLGSASVPYRLCVLRRTDSAGGESGTWSAELAVATAVFACSLLAIAASPVWLAFGYTTHGGWDWLHEARVVPTRGGYMVPPLCAAFDFVVAVLVIGWLQQAA
jgi:hypothetical protein